jgi:ATP-dependent DNA ligase
MTLSIKTPLPPMEARTVDELPTGPNWQYEPKWDGFRCIAFRHNEKIELQSKSGQPLARYFPDLVEALGELKANRFVLDGEIVIPRAGRLSFDDLLLRIHPAASRVRKLAKEHPAMFIVFDLLSSQRGQSLLNCSLRERRPLLETFAVKYCAGQAAVRLSPASTRLSLAKQWFRKVGGNLDGIIAKRLDLPYQAGNRDGMVKIKHVRSVDCVVGGFRYAEGKRTVGSLLLGLYDQAGLLHHVGFTSSFKEHERQRITKLVTPLIEPPGFTGRSPGGKSRWSTRRSEEWKPLRPQLVVEVNYDHFTGGRFRHGTSILRWRPDKAAKNCTLSQVAAPRGQTLKLLG